MHQPARARLLRLLRAVLLEGEAAELLDLLEHDLDRALDRAPSTSAESSIPISSTFAGSQATTTTLPGQPWTALTKRSTVCGSIPCGLITSPSSIPASISAGSGSIT